VKTNSNKIHYINHTLWNCLHQNRWREFLLR